MKYMQLFENLTRAKLKDCINDEPLIFIVEENEIGKAIGKGGSNISYVQDYNLGATAPLENAEAFADAVLKVLQDKSYFSSDFVRRTRAVLRDLNVTWDALVSRVESLCRSAVNSINEQ